MKTISIADSVVISLALSAQIRFNIKTAKLVGKSGADMRPYIENIRDLIHAYNAVNDTPFVSDDPFLRFFFDFYLWNYIFLILNFVFCEVFFVSVLCLLVLLLPIVVCLLRKMMNICILILKANVIH